MILADFISMINNTIDCRQEWFFSLGGGKG